MFAIQFDSKVEKILKKWKKSNPVVFKKLRRLLDDRIIYKIYDEEIIIIVLELEGHYDDK